MERLGIESLSIMGALSPVEFVNLAGDLDVRHVSLVLAMPPNNPQGNPGWSLIEDAGLRRKTIATLRGRDVTVSMIDGFVIRAGHDIGDRAADFEIAAELGGTRLNIKSLDSDLQRNLDQFAATAELGAAVGIETSTEFGPSLSSENLSDAVDAVRYVNRPDFRILMDSMHFFRSGGTIEDITALDPEIFAYIQLSDVPRVATIADYFEEATRERMVPGEGELPLLDFLAALPRDLVIGLEVPIRSLAEAGVGQHERMRRCVEAARNLLAELDTLDSQAEAAHAQAASD